MKSVHASERSGPDLYLDYNGSTPVHPLVVEAAWPYLRDEFANPSAAHPAGARARAAIDRARETIAAGLGCRASEIWFTSGGTESNNWALFGSLPREERAHVVVSAIEHKSVLSTADELERLGHRVTRIGVDPSGAVRVRDVELALNDDTALVSVMCANNETGIVQPAREIGALCRRHGIRFHTDAVCTLGKLPIDVRELGCDLLSLSSHKLYSPKGLGVLFVREGVSLRPFVHGCGQQNGMRGGTENPFTVVAFARAFELMQRGVFSSGRRVDSLRDELWRGLQERFPDCRRNGQGASLPNTLNVYFPGCLASDLQRELGRSGISVASGAAANGGTPSHVLLAMGATEDVARCSLRFSLGAASDASTLRAVLDALEVAVSTCCSLVTPQPGRSA